MARALHQNSETEYTEDYFDGVFSDVSKGNCLDSATSISEATKPIIADVEKMPAKLKKLVSELGDEGGRILDSVVIGMREYKARHGQLPTGDVIEAALHQGLTVTDKFLKESGRAFDHVSTSNNSDPISSQANRAIIAVTISIAEAIPFAMYAPADIGSNESRIVIVSHQAGTTTGAYTAGDSLDGINAGSAYLASERTAAVTLSSGNTVGAATLSYVAGGSTATGMMRGRTQILVNGIPCAAESPNVGASVSASPIAGTATIAGTDYTIAGTVVVATGVVALTFSPALPSGTVVTAEGYIDYEYSTQSTLAPKVITQAIPYPLYSSPWRGIVQQTIDARTQMANELGISPQNEGMIAMRSQMGLERHYIALTKALGVATKNGNVQAFDFAGSTQLDQKTRAQIAQDFMIKINMVSQQMANDTMEYGVKYVYTGNVGLSLLMSLPETLFKPSGISPRPSIYWAGTYANGIEVYYTPKIITESSTATQFLCIGKSTQVARCPIVLGDAVALTIENLSNTVDFKSGVLAYARNFTAVNPHKPSALGAGLVNVTGIL